MITSYLVEFTRDTEKYKKGVQVHLSRPSYKIYKKDVKVLKVYSPVDLDLVKK